MPGSTLIGLDLAHYRILDQIGEGGMGVVYKARDTHLDRLVALKVLPGDKVADPDRKRRFVRGAKAASALNHPNIITIHDIAAAMPGGAAQVEPVDFIAMEYIEGRSLGQVIAAGSLSVEEALGYAVQIAAGLAAAHAAGIVHRDIKPANIMVTASGSTGGHQGQIKILDFGLAKLSERALEPDSPTQTAGARTEDGAILGTVAYMSPEQAEGKALDARTDIFSFGCVLYEMLARQRPFQGESNLSILTAILHRQPTPLKKLRPDVPARLQDILSRALERDRDRRYPSAAELRHDLVACQSQVSTGGPLSLLRKPMVAVSALVLLVTVLAAGAWLGVRSHRVRWARDVGLPEIASLIAQDDYGGAFALAKEAAAYIPDDSMLATLWPQMSMTIDIESNPPGAEVSIRDYRATTVTWQALGRTPISGLRLPLALRRARLVRDGHVLREGWLSRQSQTLGATPHSLRYDLTPVGSVPEGMVWVPGVHPPLEDAGVNMVPVAGLDHLLPFLLGDYLIDQYEVTNKSYKEFVDAGGYRTPAYWRVPFVKDGRTLSFEEAVESFIDATGRPGPSTWQVSEYPKGRGQDPAPFPSRTQNGGWTPGIVRRHSPSPGCGNRPGHPATLKPFQHSRLHRSPRSRAGGLGGRFCKPSANRSTEGTGVANQGGFLWPTASTQETIAHVLTRG